MCSLSSCNIIQTLQIVSILNSLEYEYFHPYSSGHLPITEDIQIIGTVVITSEQLEVPDRCLERDDCRHNFGFSNANEIDGVLISPNANPEDYVYPTGALILTNVRVRFRKLIIDTHPSMFNHIPVMQVLPPSDYECEESEIKCEHDQVCYSTFFYCEFCLELSPQECVCRDENGTFPDGTSCEFGGDAIITGECQDGECIPDWF
jgi:hypothetical protein